jgi:hypothetical protein
MDHTSWWPGTNGSHKQRGVPCDPKPVGDSCLMSLLADGLDRPPAGWSGGTGRSSGGVLRARVTSGNVGARRRPMDLGPFQPQSLAMCA